MANFNPYIDKPSLIHRLNPSLKIIIILFLIILVFLPTGLFGQVFLLVISLILWFMARLPWRTMKPILKSMIFMVLILFFINWLSYKSPGLCVDINGSAKGLFGINWGANDHNNWFLPTGLNVPPNLWCAHGLLLGGEIYHNTGIFYSINNFDINHLIPSEEGYKKVYDVVYSGGDKIGYVVIWYKASWYCLSSDVFVFTIYVSLKIMIMIMLVTILTSTTNSVQLSFAVEDLLSPLRAIRLPVNEWAMTISIAIRFVPSLLQEAHKILNAQASRGIDFHNGKFNEKVKSLVSLVVPMFSIAFYKADDLANAMEARAYNPRYIRTRYRSYVIKWYDWFSLFFASIFLAFFVVYVIKHFYFDAFGWPEAILNYGG